ncbi:ATP-binding protein [Desulfosarcina sp.]|uniref:hybrid sensor histidine kinase/response regulator n=1 Tax=Desulfosarcina sp. TaxID=2027861 RepID=UPI003567EB41
MSIDCQQDLFKALDMVVLVYLDDDRCTLLGDVPGWFCKLCPDVLPGSLPASPEERFPFLMNFLVDAREFWDLGKGGRIRSGVCVQTAPDGDDMAFEASAVLLNDLKVLLIESCEYDYSEKQSLIQTGRQLALDLHRHQRQERFAKALRQELEAQVKQRTGALLHTNLRLKTEIQERQKAEHALRESEHRFRMLFDNLFDAQLLLDADGRIQNVNRAACHLISCSRNSLCGRKVTDLFPEHEVDKIHSAFAHAAREGIAYIEESVINGENQTLIQVEGGGVGLDMDGCRHVVISLRDISHRKQLQSQLQQAQKMEAMGSLASGISHDFNNILSAIIGYTEIVRLDLDEHSLAYRNLDQVLAAGNRAKNLVQQILTFSRQADNVNQPVKVCAIVTEAIKLIQATTPSSIEIRHCLESQSYVRCDPTQLHQICINLFSNAGHAMEADGGVMEVRLTDINLDDDFASAQPGIRPGPHIQLSVADTGKGIAEPILGKIFDPFFTTKAAGKGTGMGLSVVHGIVAATGGAITVESRAGTGCCFKVYLPVLTEPVAESSQVQPVMQTGTERILFVDDEKFQVDLATQVLVRLGYTIVAKTSSLEALAIFKEDPTAFDLVITDLTMPHLAGDALAKKIHGLRPDLPIILSSGFSTSISDEVARGMGFSAYLKKPLVMRELSVAIRSVLNGEQAREAGIDPI